MSNKLFYGYESEDLPELILLAQRHAIPLPPADKVYYWQPPIVNLLEDVWLLNDCREYVLSLCWTIPRAIPDMVHVICDHIHELDTNLQINLVKLVPNDILTELFSHTDDDYDLYDLIREHRMKDIDGIDLFFHRMDSWSQMEGRCSNERYKEAILEILESCDQYMTANHKDRASTLRHNLDGDVSNVNIDELIHAL